ncbi:hypothetical protein GQ53DRAFT_651523, partial [Thozetella sp. PMI_491]
LERWTDDLSGAMGSANRPIAIDTAQSKAAITAAGLVEFHKESVRVPYNR